MAGDLKVRRSFDSVFGFKLVDQRDLDNTSCPFVCTQLFRVLAFSPFFFLEIVLSGTDSLKGVRLISVALFLQ